MEQVVDYGWLTIIPPLLAIVLAFVTKNVLLSLVLGVFSGALIMAGGNPLVGIRSTLDTIVAQVADDWNAKLLLFNLLMGAGIALIWRLNGSRALTEWARPKIKTRTGVGVGAWLLGILVFFNDYCNAAIVGNVFRDISEERRVSSEKLSFILDATAAPVATFFISDWIAFQLGMISQGMQQAGIPETAITPLAAYIKSIPLNFYCILMVLFVGMVAIFHVDFGPMKKAEIRAQKEGKVIRDGAHPMLNVESDLGTPNERAKPRLINFFLPIIALVVVTLIGFYYSGAEADPEAVGLINILGNADAAVALVWGAFAMSITGILLALVSRSMTMGEAMDSVVDGMKLMLLACVILVLAWSMGSITGDMHLADFVVTQLGESFPMSVLPVTIFIIGMLISFATGTSWGTMTILTPIAISLAYKITGDTNTAVMMAGVVFSGAIFGDHCSPISDTTVLASIFSGADHIDHVKSQIPYALTVAAVAAVGYLIYGFTRFNPLIMLPILLIPLYLVAKVLGSNPKFSGSE